MTWTQFLRSQAGDCGVDTATFDALVDQPFEPALNPSEIKFVNSRTFSIAASIDADRRPWASVLLGQQGELFSVTDPETVKVTPQRIAGDPLRDNIAATGELGILYINPSIRRRAKSLGRATIEADESITYRMTRAYGICTKYIFKRSHELTTNEQSPQAPQARQATHLDADDKAQLTAADTVFLATHHVEPCATSSWTGPSSGTQPNSDACSRNTSSALD